MNTSPIFVVARDFRTAETFVAVDLRENPARTRLVRDDSGLRGMHGARTGQLVFFHPTASDLPKSALDLIDIAIQSKGLMTCTVDDSHARAYYYAEQMRRSNPEQNDG